MKQKTSAASHVSGLESECYCNTLSDITVSDATIRNNHDVITRNKYYSCIHAMQCMYCLIRSSNFNANLSSILPKRILKQKKDKDELKQYTQSLHMQVKMFLVLCLCLRALHSSGNETA